MESYPVRNRKQRQTPQFQRGPAAANPRSVQNQLRKRATPRASPKTGTRKQIRNIEADSLNYFLFFHILFIIPFAAEQSQLSSELFALPCLFLFLSFFSLHAVELSNRRERWRHHLLNKHNLPKSQLFGKASLELTLAFVNLLLLNPHHSKLFSVHPKLHLLILLRIFMLQTYQP